MALGARAARERGADAVAPRDAGPPDGARPAASPLPPARPARLAMRTLDPLTARARRTLQVARLDARPGLRRELLAMDYVLPLARLRSGSGPLRLNTRSAAAAGSLYFGRESFPVDRVAYFGIFLEGWYGGEYDGAVVVDIG